MDAFDRWQLEKYGNILTDINNTPDDELFENGIEELERMAEWMNEQAELQILNHAI